jgi:hypothetical protein
MAAVAVAVAVLAQAAAVPVVTAGVGAGTRRRVGRVAAVVARAADTPRDPASRRRRLRLLRQRLQTM